MRPSVSHSPAGDRARFPRREDPSAPAGAGEVEECLQGRILVVDDERRNRDLLRHLLGAYGHTVIEAADGLEALERVRDSEPDVVLLDVMMPRLDGYETCRRIKHDPATAHLPVLLVTALSGRDDRIRGIDLGANDFLTKPIDSRDVLLRVRNALYTKRLFDRLRASYQELRELDALKDNLAQMMVHDMQSPLTGLTGMLQFILLDEGEQLSEQARDSLRWALESSRLLMEMIRALLDVSRLEAGSMPLEIEECDLAEVVAEAVQCFGLLEDGKRITVHAPQQQASCPCDREVVRRVLTNLIGNALRYSPAGGEVAVHIEALADGVQLSVCDQGPGIPAEFRERIFEKFGQVRDRKQEGRHRRYTTGLGLTFCKLAVEAHGGRIWVESEIDRGSTFRFTLPRRCAGASAPPPGASSGSSQRAA